MVFAVQLLACGVRVFFFKSPTRLDRAKQKKIKKKMISEMISKHTCRLRRVNTDIVGTKKKRCVRWKTRASSNHAFFEARSIFGTGTLEPA